MFVQGDLDLVSQEQVVQFQVCFAHWPCSWLSAAECDSVSATPLPSTALRSACQGRRRTKFRGQSSQSRQLCFVRAAFGSTWACSSLRVFASPQLLACQTICRPKYLFLFRTFPWGLKNASAFPSPVGICWWDTNALAAATTLGGSEGWGLVSLISLPISLPCPTLAPCAMYIWL